MKEANFWAYTSQKSKTASPPPPFFKCSDKYFVPLPENGGWLSCSFIRQIVRWLFIPSTQEVFLFVKILFFVQIFFPTIENSENLACLGSLYAHPNTRGEDLGSPVVKLTRLYALGKGGLKWRYMQSYQGQKTWKKKNYRTKTNNKTQPKPAVVMKHWKQWSKKGQQFFKMESSKKFFIQPNLCFYMVLVQNQYKYKPVILWDHSEDCILMALVLNFLF